MISSTQGLLAAMAASGGMCSKTFARTLNEAIVVPGTGSGKARSQRAIHALISEQAEAVKVASPARQLAAQLGCTLKLETETRFGQDQ